MKRAGPKMRGKVRSFYRTIELAFAKAGATRESQWLEYPRSASNEFHEAVVRFSRATEARGWPEWFRKFCHYPDGDLCGVRIEVLDGAPRKGSP